MMRISWSNRFEPRLSFRVYVLEKEEVGSFCLPASVVSFPMGWRRSLVVRSFPPPLEISWLSLNRSIVFAAHLYLRCCDQEPFLSCNTEGRPPLGVLHRQHLPAMSCVTEITTLLWHFFNVLLGMRKSTHPPAS